MELYSTRMIPGVSKSGIVLLGITVAEARTIQDDEDDVYEQSLGGI